MKKGAVLAALLYAWAWSCPAQEASPYDTSLSRLVQSLVDTLPEKTLSEQRLVAVGDFVCGSISCNGTRYTGKLGHLLSTDVSAFLVREKRLRVVTRDALDDLLNEKDFWLSDMVSGRTIPKVKRDFSAFTLLVRGRYFADVRKDEVRVSAEVIEVQTGEKLASTSVMLPTRNLPVPPDSKELSLAESLAGNLNQTATAVTKITKAQPEGDRVRVRVWTDSRKKVFKEGKKLGFKVSVDRDAYLWLFDVRPDGKTVMIFPNAYHKENFLEAGKVIRLPGEEMGFEFVVEPPFGPEAVQAVATTSRVASEEVRTRGGLDPSSNAANPFREVTVGTKGLAETIKEVHTRGVKVRPKETPPAWAEDHWTFVTEK